MGELPVHGPTWIDTARLRNVVERRLAVDRDTVWARIADHETWPEWFTALDRVRITGEPAAVGGRREVTAGRITMGEVFTVWEPGEQFAFAVVRANRTLAGMAESVELRSDGDGCVVLYRQGVEPARGFGWLWRLIMPRLRSETERALERLETVATS